MDNKNYQLNLIFPGAYREIKLCAEKMQQINIGTTHNCEVRFSQELFPVDFEFHAVWMESDGWLIQSGTGVYLGDGGPLMQRTIAVTHGKKFSVCYEDSGVELCRGEFLIDFQGETQDYCRSILLQGINRLRIGGGSECQVQLTDGLVGTDTVQLVRSGNNWTLVDNNTRYGVTVNGMRVQGQKTIFSYDFFSLAGHSFFLLGERLYTGRDPAMKINGLTLMEHNDSTSQMRYPHLNRSTRIYYKLPEDKIEVQDPPSKQKPPERNLLVTLLPSLAMLVLIILLRGVMGNGGTYVIFSVCSMSIGVLTSLYTYKVQKKNSKKDEEKRVALYTEYIQEKEQSIQKLRNKEALLLEWNTPAIDTSLQTVWKFDGRLYERTPHDEDYLSVRLGTGAQDSCCPVQYRKQEIRNGEDPLTEWPRQISEKYTSQPQSPVLLSLKDTPMVGIVGTKDLIYETVKLMTLDLCIHHSYQNLQMVYLFPGNLLERWSWLRWLRHAHEGAYGARNLAYDEDSYKNLLDFLYKELSDREQRSAAKNGMQFTQNYIVFVMEPFEIMRHPISRFFSADNSYGFTFVFCREAEELLPPCDKIVRLNGNSCQIQDAKDGNQVQLYVPAIVSDKQVKRAAVKLACVTVDEVSLASQLTKNISLYRLLGIYSAEDLDLGRQWGDSVVYKSMAAPLGVNAKNEVVSLDLHEKAHGPHGLVAGTTGSGKSELLQSYILSMAIRFHPYEVAFVIIDFKGGGMVNQFRDLPHLVGSITDIDGREIDRSLMSIRAELNKRKELFAQANVNHIDAYIKKFKSGEVKTPLPHLILIVDEFAELKTDQPEFMKELISAARIGRSLGVHLILATQKPSGVVDAQIWSNSRFKLCLKVQTPEDSKEMLKTPLAAEIREPGRAYLQVGNNEIFELFQSAYSGGAANSEIATGQRAYALYSVEPCGQKKLLYKTRNEKKRQAVDTQLEAMVRLVSAYCTEKHIERLPGICLPPLKLCYPLPKYRLVDAFSAAEVEMGIYDAPERQIQLPVTLNLSAGNLMIIGAPQYGKSNILQLIAKQLAEKLSPEQVNMYILDFASLSLGTLENLPHIGGIVRSGDDEKLKNLFKMLNAEMESRKQRLGEMGVTSFTAYLEAGYSGIPQIIVMIDNYTALKELYLQDDDPLLPLCRDGISMGISFVLTNVQTTGIGYKYMSDFSYKMALHCNENSEYGALFGYCHTSPRNVAGRFIMELDKQIYEAQAYIAFEGEKEFERGRNAIEFVKQQKAEWGNLHAQRIPMIPEVLKLSEVLQDYPEAVMPYSVPLGLDYQSVSLRTIDLRNLGALGICGSAGMGKRNWVGLALAMLEKQKEIAPYKVYFCDDVRRRYAAFEHADCTAAYSIAPDDSKRFIAECHSALQQRYERLLEGNMNALSAELLVLIFQNPEAIAGFSTDKTALEQYRDLVGKFKSMGVCVIFADVENNGLNYSSPEPYKILKEHKNFLIFENFSDLKLFDIPLATFRQFKRPLQVGDAYYFHESDCIKLRTPLCDSGI